MTKKYRISRAWLQGYDFIGKDGKAVKGVTPKALVFECDERGGIVRSSIDKCDKSITDRVGANGVSVSVLYYDKFGRLVGWQE